MAAVEILRFVSLEPRKPVSARDCSLLLRKRHMGDRLDSFGPKEHFGGLRIYLMRPFVWLFRL